MSSYPPIPFMSSYPPIPFALLFLSFKTTASLLSPILPDQSCLNTMTSSFPTNMDFLYTRNASNITWVCINGNYSMKNGVFVDGNPFRHPSPVLFAQLSFVTVIYAFMQILLAPLNQTTFVSVMLVGIINGPAALGKVLPLIGMIFPEKSLYVNQTVAYFGCLLFLFLVGVKMDVNMVRQSGKKAVVIGLCAFFVPMISNTAFASLLMDYLNMNSNLRKSLLYVAAHQSLSSFHVITCFLADLKLLNSELGRLAVSSGMISGMCSWSWTLIVFASTTCLKGDKNTFILMLFCFGCMLILIIYIMKPIMVWMSAQMSQGKGVKEIYIVAVFLMLLVCAFLGEAFGQHLLFGPILLGSVVPDGPPLGSALVEKLDTFVSSILIPAFFASGAAQVDLSLIHLRSFGVVELLAFFGFFGKLIGVMLASLYFKMPLLDALPLGLMISTQGVTDVLILQHARQFSLIDEEAYSIMVVSMVLITATISPVVKALYKPSERYTSYSYHRRSIQHSRPDAELRILACIYHQESTPSIINLLEVSNPTEQSPICFYVVHFIELNGRSSPILVAHKPGRKKSQSSIHYSDHIINAFRLYEQQYGGIVLVNPFTSISPPVTMHQDVCTLALDKRVSMVIIPFHKQYLTTIQGREISRNTTRDVNRNILKNAPCSVGILVDRGTLCGGAITNVSILTGMPLYKIGMIFLGGQDDREALAYAMRMSDHPDVLLTVVRIVESTWKDSMYNDTKEKQLDFNLISEYRLLIKGETMRHVYKEVVIVDCVEMINEIRKVENSFDLILVGRRYSPELSLFVGLKDWFEFPELGFLGDMLASWDSSCKASVLVVQQQTYAGDSLMLDCPNLVPEYCLLKQTFSVVDVPKNTARVVPNP